MVRYIKAFEFIIPCLCFEMKLKVVMQTLWN